MDIEYHDYDEPTEAEIAHAVIAETSGDEDVETAREARIAEMAMKVGSLKQTMERAGSGEAKADEGAAG